VIGGEAMFGSEQSYLQKRKTLRLIYRVIGEYRFPLRLRNFYLRQSLPFNFHPKNIWDAGCGRGQTTFFLAKIYPHAMVLGTDISSKAVEQCTLIMQQSHSGNISFHVRDLVESDFENSFDMIMLFEVLEHIDDYQTAIQKISKALRPGGYLILHTPAEGKFQADNFGLRKFAAQPEGHSEREQGQYHVRSGFQVSDLVACMKRNELIPDLTTYTFGPLAMLAHTVYEHTRSRSLYMLITFPLLFILGMFDWYLPKMEGGGILIRAQKG